MLKCVMRFKIYKMQIVDTARNFIVVTLANDVVK